MIIVLCTVGFYVAVNQPRVQTWLTQTIASILSSQINADVSVGSVHIKFFKRIEVRDVYVEDQQGDTLLYAQRLYANLGRLQPFKNKYDVKKIELKGTYVNLYQQPGSDHFNYQFLLDSLLSKNKQPDTSSTQIDLKLQDITIHDLRFNMNDSVAEQSFVVALTKLDIGVDRLDLPDKIVSLNKLAIDGLNIAVTDFRTCTDELVTTSDQQEQDLSPPMALNPDCWHIDINNLGITGSSFHLDQNRFIYDNRGMDYHHIGVDSIDISIPAATIEDETLIAQIDHIAAKEQSGFTLNKLSGLATITPQSIAISDMTILTPNSNINNYYSMEFDRFSDFNKYETKVYMTGRFNKAKVSVKDINYFARAIPFLAHNTVNLTGEVKGTVSGLKGRDLRINFGRYSSFAGNFSFYGLPNFDETFISFDIDRINTSASDLARVYPDYPIPPELVKFGMVNFSGNFDGFYNDFVANGQLATSIGVLNSDINFKIDPKTGLAAYSGNFSAEDFDLGKWAGNDTLLGKVTASARLKGSGMKVHNINAYADGNVQSITISGYQYNNIDLNGEFSNRLFNGHLVVHDPNLDMNFDGNINLEDSIPRFNFVASIDTANLKALKLIDIPFSFSTKLDLNLTGNTADNIRGRVSVRDTRITQNGEYYWLDSLHVSSEFGDQFRNIELQSDIMRGSIQGDFTFSKLPQTFKIFLNHYFQPGYVMPGADSIPQQNFTYSLKIDDTRNLTELITPQLSNIEGGLIEGQFNSEDQKFRLNGSFPSIQFLDTRWSTIDMNFQSSQKQVTFATSVDTIFITDSLYTNYFKVNGGIIKDSVEYHITLEDSLAPNYLSLHGTLKSDLKNYEAHLNESFLRVKNQTWQFDDNNYIGYDGKNLSIKDLTLANDSSFIALATQVLNEKTNLNVTFNEVRLGHIIPGADKLHLIGATFDGRVNGSLNIIKMFSKPAITSYLTIDSLMVNDHLAGNLKFTSNYMNNADHINARMILEGANRMMIAGSYNFMDKNNSLNFTGVIDSFSIPMIEPFVSKYVSKLAGYAKGKITVVGNTEKPVLTGDLTINKGHARVNYLNTLYSFDNEHVSFEPDRIVLNDMILKDVKNHKAKVSGYIKHQYFKDFNLAIDIDTKNFQFLNTNSASTESFYGEVYAGGYVYISGTPDLVDFYAAATTKPETKFFLSVNSTKDVDRYSFYQFIQKDTNVANINDRFEVENDGIRLNFDIEATQDAEVNLILSQEQGDIITARGKGDIVMELDEFGEMTMVGDYVIEDGNYTFTMQNVINKKFEIEKGSQVLWTGDPYDARLSINAVYKLRAAPYDLIEDVLKDDQPLQQSRNRVPVYLYLKLFGSLLSPDISFDISVPESDPGIRSAVDAKIALIKTDQNELNKQVVGLLVLNRFLPVYPIGSEANSNIVEGLNNTVSEFISNQLSLYLTDWISKFVTEVQLDINYRDYQNQINNSNPTGTNGQTDFQNRRELQLALTKSFFNDRVEIDVGGNFDFGETANTDPNVEGTTRSSNIAGDFEIRYKITADGRIQVKVFRKGEYDVFQERNRNKTGIGIAYKKEFDTVRELVKYNREKRKKRRNKRNKKNEDTSTPDANTPVTEE